MPAQLATVEAALAVFSASRSQEAWEGLEAGQLVIEVQLLIPALQEALAGGGIVVRDALPSFGVLVLTAPSGKAVTVGFIMTRAFHHGIEQHEPYGQLMRELRAGIESIAAVNDPVGF